MLKKLILPKFKNEDDERDFWSKIDLSEYFEKVISNQSVFQI